MKNRNCTCMPGIEHDNDQLCPSCHRRLKNKVIIVPVGSHRDLARVSDPKQAQRHFSAQASSREPISKKEQA